MISQYSNSVLSVSHVTHRATLHPDQENQQAPAPAAVPARPAE